MVQIEMHPGIEGGWPWPIACHQYERASDLSNAEQAALAEVVRRCAINHIRGLDRLLADLERLVRPIHDVMARLAAPPRRCNDVIMALVREMHGLQRTFWGWSEAEWLELWRGTSPANHGITSLREARQYLVAVGYVLCNVVYLHDPGRFQIVQLAAKVFGTASVETAIQSVSVTLADWGYNPHWLKRNIHCIVSLALLTNRSPHLSDLTDETLRSIQQLQLPHYLHTAAVPFSRVLASRGILTAPLPSTQHPGVPFEQLDQPTGVSPEWLSWCQRWHATATVAPTQRRKVYFQLINIGRWIAQSHPEMTNPADWTRAHAAECVAMIDRLTIRQWGDYDQAHYQHYGKPIAPRTKSNYLASLRTFFRDCQEWNWIPRRFDVRRAFATPRTVQALIAPDPRIIADDIWAKLLTAGLNLSAMDLMGRPKEDGSKGAPMWYPLAYVRAVAMVWLFAGLRLGEIRRLRVGCVRWYQEDVQVPGSDESLAKDAVCLLEVPANKTSGPFTKPVDQVVGEAIQAWERVRPVQPPQLDAKTNAVVQYLFAYRGAQLGRSYINHTLIPMLCWKAGVPEADARGPITSHRARSTIASQLANAKEPMTLLELQEWLGHHSPEATRQYVKVTPTKLAKSFAEAGYFERNLRTIAVLIDQEAVTSGAAASGTAWKYYDLGHGYCTYDFFDQCPHRMACAKCDFYRPKSALVALLDESKQHYLQLQQVMTLTDLELAAVEADLAATERLLTGLKDVPTPAGPTARQLEEWSTNAIRLEPAG